MGAKIISGKGEYYSSLYAKVLLRRIDGELGRDGWEVTAYKGTDNILQAFDVYARGHNKRHHVGTVSVYSSQKNGNYEIEISGKNQVRVITLKDRLLNVDGLEATGGAK